MLRFKVGKLQIRIEFLFVAIVTVFLLVDKSGVSVIGLLACLIHELGHIIMFVAVGYTPKELAFELTGIRLTKPSGVLSPLKELLVLLSGSGINLAVFLLLIKTTTQISYISIFAVTHLLLGIFNLIPLKSFDGGKILELILSSFLSDIAVSRICAVIDAIFLLLMVLACAVLIIVGRGGFTLLVITASLMLSGLLRLVKRQNK